MSQPANLAASVRQRLLNRARARSEDFSYLLTRYANERLLYRLGRSPYREQFVLKGAALFDVWGDWPHRTSRDVDLLGFGDASAERMRAVFQALTAIEVMPDGLHFQDDSVRVDAIRERQAYQGFRVRMVAGLERARITVQVDIGFGDAVRPGIVDGEYPTLLDFPAPRLRMYPRESVVAEKFEAMVRLGSANTRLKDFHDLWQMALTFDFDGASLSDALIATFERRRTALPDGTPVAFSTAFAADPQRRRQWSALLDRSGLPSDVQFGAAVELLRRFLMPPVAAAASGQGFPQVWAAGEVWLDS